MIDIKDCPCYTPSMTSAYGSRSSSYSGDASDKDRVSKRYSKKRSGQSAGAVYDDQDDTDDGSYGDSDEGKYSSKYEPSKSKQASSDDKTARRKEKQSEKVAKSKSAKAAKSRKVDSEASDELDDSGSAERYPKKSPVKSAEQSPVKSVEQSRAKSKKVRYLPKYSSDAASADEAQKKDETYASKPGESSFLAIKNTNENDNANELTAEEENELSSVNVNSAQLIDEALKSMLLKKW